MNILGLVLLASIACMAMGAPGAARDAAGTPREDGRGLAKLPTDASWYMFFVGMTATTFSLFALVVKGIFW